ncbi:septal ring lytic transglycosylase RlpA family protein [Oscillatoria sp. CS-180]|uniref:septal ring lytic transglycosylase RlpA family protein n=1 Tax=Oscillatoria sp. CS-180 TaxID=3021720 RepID=UPI00232F787A|nr:septal ring lytic transglycosylase RlpA family protein [Oscillatoria sp. CS-180]MDB9526665.1 septal ring lytic transglycosylase RlpA family protein [Oscillatoria sp. CS-180]
MALTQLINQHVDLVSNTTNKGILAKIEAGRIASLEKILGTTFNAHKKASSAKKVREKPANRIGFCRRLLVRYLLPVSATVITLILPTLYIREVSIFIKQARKSVASGWTERVASMPEKGTKATIAENKSTNPHTSFCSQEEIRWVDRDLDGERTAYGKVFRNSELTAAHAFLPPGSKIHIQSAATSQPIELEVNDRNPSLLVSYTAAHKLGVIEQGTAAVTVTQVEIQEEELDELNDSQRTQLDQFQEDCTSLISQDQTAH